MFINWHVYWKYFCLLHSTKINSRWTNNQQKNIDQPVVNWQCKVHTRPTPCKYCCQMKRPSGHRAVWWVYEGSSMVGLSVFTVTDSSRFLARYPGTGSKFIHLEIESDYTTITISSSQVCCIESVAVHWIDEKSRMMALFIHRDTYPPDTSRIQNTKESKRQWHHLT